MRGTKDQIEKHAVDIVREARALRALGSSGEVCQVLAADKDVDAGGITTYAYLVTTLAKGRTLRKLAEEYRRPGAEVPWLEVLTIFKRLTALLAQAHAAGMVYNDVKPDHVFWDRATQQFKLIDWGNVVFYEEEPERERPATDIRQVGELLYEMFMGRRSLHTLSFDDIRLPTGLDTIITKALNDGYESMDMS